MERNMPTGGRWIFPVALLAASALFLGGWIIYRSANGTKLGPIFAASFNAAFTGGALSRDPATAAMEMLTPRGNLSTSGPRPASAPMDRASAFPAPENSTRALGCAPGATDCSLNPAGGALQRESLHGIQRTQKGPGYGVAATAQSKGMNANTESQVAPSAIAQTGAAFGTQGGLNSAPKAEEVARVLEAYIKKLRHGAASSQRASQDNGAAAGRGSYGTSDGQENSSSDSEEQPVAGLAGAEKSPLIANPSFNNLLKVGKDTHSGVSLSQKGMTDGAKDKAGKEFDGSWKTFKPIPVENASGVFGQNTLRAQPQEQPDANSQ